MSEAIEPCGKPAASFILRRGMYHACVLPKGHAGDCKKGGTCIVHGPYVGENCPEWPYCGIEVFNRALPRSKEILEQIEALRGELRSLFVGRRAIITSTTFNDQLYGSSHKPWTGRIVTIKDARDGGTNTVWLSTQETRISLRLDEVSFDLPEGA